LTSVYYKKREEKRVTGREREGEGKCGLCAVCVVLELGFKRCFQPLFSIPRWPSYVMRKGGEKQERERVTPREREREREGKWGHCAVCVI
jgi:hypothetical protein